MLLAGLLSGCGEFGLQGTETVFAVGLDTMPVKYCTTDNSPAKKADWKNATLVEETIKDHLYESGLITMWQDEPYIIRLINKDKHPRSFRASEFFRDVALLKVVYDGKAHVEPCLNAVTLAPSKIAELHLVPLKKGNYDYHETGLWVPFVGEIFSSTDVGFIYVH